jgi:hypothetical protein
MPRFSKKGKVARKGRRRLQPIKAAVELVPKAVGYARQGYEMYKSGKKIYNYGKRVFDSGKRVYEDVKSRGKQFQKASVSLSDNIATVRPTVIGKRKPLTFNEKVSRVERPPILFKRNYEFSAEVNSGSKGWFSFEFNIMNNNDLQADLTTYKAQQYTDTAAIDPTASLNTSFDGAKFYVDYLSEKLSLINSTSNALTGKIHLFAHKRDNNNSYAGSVPITPINLMMYYSTNRLPLNVTSNEATVGNGWKFDTATSTLNYNAVYNMPGSAINAAGVSAHTDLMLSPSSPHIADSMAFWFRKVDTFSFDLKPGQQINKTYTFHDLKDIMREEQSTYTHLAGVSFSCVVEFQGQIVGSSTTSAVSTGFTQLSVMRSSVRQIGIRNKLKSKIYLATAPPSVIGIAQNTIINPDLGQTDTIVDYDI